MIQRKPTSPSSHWDGNKSERGVDTPTVLVLLCSCQSRERLVRTLFFLRQPGRSGKASGFGSRQQGSVLSSVIDQLSDPGQVISPL